MTTQQLAACRIERALETALLRAAGPGGPPLLAAAMHDAVFPAGARVRPRLCLAVAAACGDDTPLLTDAAAAALELLHCASLVHDDLPCFDDAETRRGRPAVHRTYGEALAVLAGDALIVLAFQTLAQGAPLAPPRAVPLIGVVAAAVGAPHGIVAGQAWESEQAIELASYHRAKTGALFAAAAAGGAIAAGGDGAAWETFGARLGHAYQVADDIRDAALPGESLGKPAGQDAAHHRPNAAAQMGLDGAVRQFRVLSEAAAAAIPPVQGAAGLRALVATEMQRLMPRKLVHQAA